MLDKKKRQQLLDNARKARDAAYAEYSNFKVGAAVLAGSGKIYTGCNIENASFSATICAERVAIFTAVAAGEDSIEAVAVIGDQDGPIAPCGCCRQVIAEFGKDADIVMANVAGKTEEITLRELLPKYFEL